MKQPHSEIKGFINSKAIPKGNNRILFQPSEFSGVFCCSLQGPGAPENVGRNEGDINFPQNPEVGPRGTSRYPPGDRNEYSCSIHHRRFVPDSLKRKASELTPENRPKCPKLYIYIYIFTVPVFQLPTIHFSDAKLPLVSGKVSIK